MVTWLGLVPAFKYAGSLLPNRHGSATEPICSKNSEAEHDLPSPPMIELFLIQIIPPSIGLHLSPELGVLQ